MALKTWDGDTGGWRTALSPSTTVCMTDDDVGAGETKKPWWIYLAQTEDPPPVRTGLPGKHLLLSQDEAVALVRYLLQSGLVEFDEKTGEPVLGRE